MPDLFPTTAEAASDQARETGIVNHLEVLEITLPADFEATTAA